ncbi:hypothetical protein COU89_01760 [Candidatus Roizmanbacteria bacterium CG10_big_fil_rev_8_21_14_0_10_45_7]|uniref:Uncharacterized protein n=1 Tax=Candidatus Roizmanbacteria bacterium CG10_big_fil_rev_8_21_14_0_10_45_7 TaxID=1974854 RepID=A0A2M8KV03_9BACT|nr:MAG: hypothetical protein COU89_01760 [Candidatus Roizmanbacteria bacterium CG10_big_fil_rev_8_21_14_0_10_45_7]
MVLGLFVAKPSSYAIENWHFEEQFTYGDDDEELLHIGSQVIMVGQNYYILDSGLSTVIELSSNGSWQEYVVEGEGPGECYQPNSLVKDQIGLVMLKALPPTLIYTDLEKKQQPRAPVVIDRSFFARNMVYVDQNKHFLANTIYTKDGLYFNALSLIDSTGHIEDNLLDTERVTGEDFPIWFYRNSWTYNNGKVAVMTDYDYSVTVFSLNGSVIENIRGPTSKQESPLGTTLQGVFYSGETLLILPSSSGDILEFQAPEEQKIIRVNGVRASSQAQYFWLNRDTLAVMYGWADRVFHTGDEENHQITFFRRSTP